MPVPKWFIDAALEDASTPKTPCAIRYYTSGLFLPIEPGEPIRIKMPGGAIRSVEADESFTQEPTPPYWRVWRGFDNADQAMSGAMEWLADALHNTNVGHPWDPVQVVCEGKIIKQWLTPEDGKMELGMTLTEEQYRHALEKLREEYPYPMYTRSDLVRILAKRGVLDPSKEEPDDSEDEE